MKKRFLFSLFFIHCFSTRFLNGNKNFDRKNMKIQKKFDVSHFFSLFDVFRCVRDAENGGQPKPLFKLCKSSETYRFLLGFWLACRGNYGFSGILR